MTARVDGLRHCIRKTEHLFYVKGALNSHGQTADVRIKCPRGIFGAERVDVNCIKPHPLGMRRRDSLPLSKVEAAQGRVPTEKVVFHVSEVSTTLHNGPRKLGPRRGLRAEALEERANVISPT